MFKDRSSSLEISLFFLSLESPHSRNTVALLWSNAVITVDYGLRKCKSGS